MDRPLLLPDSRPRVQKKVVRRGGINWTPIFCANCGVDGGLVPEQNCNFAFYLCAPCGDRWQPVAGTYLVPDELFWQRVRDEQLETYGRELTALELVELLKDGDHPLSKLCRDRPDFNQQKMS